MITPLFRMICLSVFLAFVPAHAQFTGTLKSLISNSGALAFSYSVEEYSLGPRTGPARVYSLPASTNPWMGGTFLSATEWPPQSLALRIDWGAICGSNVSLAGGSTGGWLFGPYRGGSTAAMPDIRDFIPGAPTGTVVFLAVVGTAMPDGNWAERHHCGGSKTLVPFGIQLAFIYPSSTKLGSGGYQIGDLWYYTEDLGENWYRILSSTPLGPVASSTQGVPETSVGSRGTARLEPDERSNGLIETIKQLRGE